MVHHRLSWVAAGLLFGALGCGRPDVGESCSNEGDPEECVEDALCAKDTAGKLTCLLICVDQADCPSGTNCNGTSGSRKVCQPK